ncbi:hypothetical protein [Chryseobacterium hagamense]|uniref:Uncharacterized protein n=1 Tax=Chryseobacterium hagamense TaxID=395935 RepID=A0A511YQ98_9FLAO|nr:hypothetical protein [Chryseobacterium hagamense]GEN77371.1 hypothetical protein CHA01nite_31110 [Chryseobacterium hagamense]
MKHSIFGIMEEFIPENPEEADRRYSGFGKDLYRKIQQKFPDVFRNLHYYQRIGIRIEDSYAVYCNHENSFCIQLDPLCEKIILWNEETQIEIGIGPMTNMEKLYNLLKMNCCTGNKHVNSCKKM